MLCTFLSVSSVHTDGLFFPGYHSTSLSCSSLPSKGIIAYIPSYFLIPVNLTCDVCCSLVHVNRISDCNIFPKFPPMVPLVVVFSNIVSWTLGMIFATATPPFDFSTATFVPDVFIGRVRVKLCPVYHKPFDVIGVSCVPHTPTCF